MQALIDFVVKNLLALWPIARVDEWQLAVLVRAGHIVRALSPGLHWRWPFVEEVKVSPRREVTIDLPVGAVTTTDGGSVAISANVGYRVVDIVKSWRTVWNTDESLGNLALGLLATECASRPWTTLAGDRRALEANLLAQLNATTSEWGVEVVRLNLTDLVRARQYRLIGDQPRGRAG